MKRFALLMVAVATLALVPAGGAAAASSSPNTGCPASASGWDGPYTIHEIFTMDVTRATAPEGGYTEASLMALFGVDNMKDLEAIAFDNMSPMDKNADGKLCIKRNQSLVNLGLVYADMVIDNMAHVTGS